MHQQVVISRNIQQKYTATHCLVVRAGRIARTNKEKGSAYLQDCVLNFLPQNNGATRVMCIKHSCGSILKVIFRKSLSELLSVSMALFSIFINKKLVGRK